MWARGAQRCVPRTGQSPTIRACSARMRNFVRTLSGRSELIVVLLIAFGIFVPGNLAALVSHPSPSGHTAPPLTEAHLVGVLLYELLIFSILLPFLRARGWTFKRLGMRGSRWDLLVGLMLAVGAYLTYAVLAIVVGRIWPVSRAALTRVLVGSHITWGTAIAVSVVNPVFEEMFVCGYLVTTLKDRIGPHHAVNVSTGIRVLYHLYQGIQGVIGIAPFGLILGYWFARTGRLWPVIVAHAVTDFAGLWSSGAL